MVITASRRAQLQEEAAVATEVIDRQAIEASGAMNVADLLAIQPGVEIVRSFAGAGVRLQGMDPDYVLILVDGERVNGRTDGVLDLSRLAVDDLERVEIVKGATSALYGAGAMGGVVNLITRDSGPRAEVRAAYGGLGTADVAATLGGGRGRGRGRLTAGVHRGDAWDLDPADAATTGSAFLQGDASARGSLELGRALRLGAGLSWLQRRSEGVDAAATGAVFDRTNLTEAASARADASWLPTPRAHLRGEASLSVYRDQYLSDQRGSGALDSYQETWDRQIQGDLQWDQRLSDPHTLTVGAELLGEHLRTPRLADEDASRIRGALFLNHDAQLWQGRLAVVPGLRLDLDSQFGAFPSPRLAARLSPTQALTLRAGAGRGYKAPDFKELYLIFENPGVGYRVEGNPGLIPERSLSLTLGIGAQPACWLKVSLGAFQHRIDDMIGIDLAPSEAGDLDRYTYVNVDAARLRGVEASVTLSPLPGGAITAGYMGLDAWDLSLQRPLEGRSPHQGSLLIRWAFEALGLVAQLRGAAFAPRPFYLPDGEGAERVTLAPAYLDLGATLTKALGRHAEIQLMGLNLLGAGDAIYLPIQPRLLRLGASFNW